MNQTLDLGSISVRDALQDHVSHANFNVEIEIKRSNLSSELNELFLFFHI